MQTKPKLVLDRQACIKVIHQIWLTEGRINRATLANIKQNKEVKKDERRE